MKSEKENQKIRLIKFITGHIGSDRTEYIIKDNDSVFFGFFQELNGFYYVSIYWDKMRYDLKNCKRLSESQKNLFILNYYNFINYNEIGVLDINNLIEVISMENFTDE